MRSTVQRQIIFEAIKELNNHASAEQVVEYLAHKHPSIGRATIYRNLKYMSETGELLCIGSFYGSTHYDHNNHDHYHFVCNNCRCVIDIDGTVADIIGNLHDAKGLDITSGTVLFGGLCLECK